MNLNIGKVLTGEQPINRRQALKLGFGAILGGGSLLTTGCKGNQTREVGERAVAVNTQNNIVKTFKADAEKLTEFRHNLAVLKKDVQAFTDALPKADGAVNVDLTAKDHKALYDQSFVLRENMQKLKNHISSFQGTPSEKEKLEDAYNKIAQQKTLSVNETESENKDGAFLSYIPLTEKEQIANERENLKSMQANTDNEKILKETNIRQIDSRDRATKIDYLTVEYGKAGSLDQAINELNDVINVIDAKYDVLINMDLLGTEVEELCIKKESPETSRSTISGKDIETRVSTIKNILDQNPGVYDEIQSSQQENRFEFNNWLDRFVELANSSEANAKELRANLAELPKYSAYLSDRLKTKIAEEQRK